MRDDWLFGLWKPQPNHLLLPFLHGVCWSLYRSLGAVAHREAKKRTQILTACYVDLSVQTS